MAKTKPNDLIAAQLRDCARTLSDTVRLAPQIASAAELLIQACRRESKIIIFGNGGSAAEAQHMAAELVGRFERNRPALAALALNANCSDLTAIGNDFGFEDVFSRQLEAHARPGDVAVAISTSGNSPNVLKACGAARKLGLSIIGLTGRDGGRLKNVVDICLRTPSDATSRVQEAHLSIIHIWCAAIETGLFSHSPRAH
jgi:D-sedoheptulose 7-phosphate isomerase